MSKKFTLQSSDGQLVEVEESVAMQSQTIKFMIDDGCAENVIPLPNVPGHILLKVMEYCKKHAEDPLALYSDSEDLMVEDSKDPLAEDSEDLSKATDDLLKNWAAELRMWDAEFVKLDQETLVDVILAANFLNIEGLLELTCNTVADMFKGKTTEQIRETFNIKSDFTPEEEAEILRENKWAFD